ncbi:MAG: alpha/beta fold hydrolase [Sedimentisphaerales bacterium]
MLTRRIIGIAGISLWAGLIVIAAAKGFAGDNAEPAKKAVQGAEAEPKSIETLAKDLVSALASGDCKKATENFDETMKKALPAEKLQEAWNSLIAQFGPFVEQAGTLREKVLQYDVIFVTCKFEKGALDAKIVFDGNKQIAGLFFVPAKVSAPEKPADLVSSDVFSEKEVRVGTGQLALPGTLTLPKGQGPFPAVVLVHGSGPQDRDETIGPSKPFRDLAHGLASRGIAVLRYEKRTKAFPIQMAAIKNTLTVKEEVVDDALAAAALLRESSQIDPNKVFVLGHSLGGYLIPRIGKGDSKIAGFIIMAGTARPVEDVVLEQFTYVFSLDGVITDTEKTSLEQLKSQVAKVKDPQLSPETAAADLPLGVPAAYWLDLRGYQPAEVAKELTQPMLIMQGGRDYQVTEADFQLWKKTLSSQKNVEFKFYEGLNHLFVEGQGKSTPAEYEQAGHIAEAVIGDIAGWISRQAASPL